MAPSTTTDRINDLTNKYEALLLQIEGLKKIVSDQAGTITTLKNKIEMFESTPAQTTAATLGEWNIIAGKPAIKTTVQLDMLNCMATEQKQRDKRQKNLVIFGLPSSAKTDATEKQADDVNAVQGLLEKLSIEKGKLVRCFRLKSRIPEKPAPVVVEMADATVRNQIVKVARRKFPGIFINPDLTEAQRHLDKKLRDECRRKNEPLSLKDNWSTAKHYYAIRNSEVVRIDK
jgi:hypothetical protein